MSDYGNTNNQGVGSVHMGDNVHIQLGGDPDAITFEEARTSYLEHARKAEARIPTDGQHAQAVAAILNEKYLVGLPESLEIVWPFARKEASLIFHILSKRYSMKKALPVFMKERPALILAKARDKGLAGLNDFEEFRFFGNRNFVAENSFVLFFLPSDFERKGAELQKALSESSGIVRVKVVTFFHVELDAEKRIEFEGASVSPNGAPLDSEKIRSIQEATLKDRERYRGLLGHRHPEGVSYEAVELFLHEDDARVKEKRQAEQKNKLLEKQLFEYAVGQYRNAPTRAEKDVITVGWVALVIFIGIIGIFTFNSSSGGLLGIYIGFIPLRLLFWWLVG